MDTGVINATHPSVSALYDTLTPNDWEGLAVLASVGVITRPPGDATLRRLEGFGATAGGVVTAAGYALLLAWHRRHPRRPWWRDWRRWENRRHEVRMRLLIDAGSEDTF